MDKQELCGKLSIFANFEMTAEISQKVDSKTNLAKIWENVKTYSLCFCEEILQISKLCKV
jgi:hypothetical protein